MHGSSTICVISGSQRSGTTLLGLVLNSHSQVRLVGEEDYQRFVEDDEDITERVVCFKLPMVVQLVDLLGRYGPQKILWCSRDPRAVVASMLSLVSVLEGQSMPWANNPMGAQAEICWAIKYLSEVPDELLDKYEIVRQISGAERTREDAVHMASIAWRLKQEFYMGYLKEKYTNHLVVYEEFVSDPKRVITDILNFIGLEWQDSVMRHHVIHEGSSVGDTDNTRAIDNQSIEKWKRQLSTSELDIVKQICGETASKLGYGLK